MKKRTSPPSPSSPRRESAPNQQASRPALDARAEGSDPDNDGEAKDIEALRTRLEALERLKVFKEARDDFLLYCRLLMPTPGCSR